MTTGVLPFEDLKKKVHLVTGFFETSQYTEDAQMYVTSGNHDQAGLSIGNLQYNFGQADRAQEWFKYMIDNHVTVVNSAFGANTTQLNEFKNVINTYVRADRITWGDSISKLVNGEKRALIDPYKDAFGTMLISAEGKAKYYSMKDAYYWTPSYELFRHLSCTSRAALASLFDAYVNKGRYYPVNAIVADFDGIDANGALTAAEKEAQKIYQINWRGNYTNAVKPTPNAWDGSIDQNIFWHGDGVDDGRRGCMANQGGTYYGAVYDPETQFDLNQEPATDEKVGSVPINVNLGDIAVNNIFLGDTQVSKLYLGATLIGGGEVSPVTSSRVPKTQFRTNAGSYAGIPDQSNLTIDSGLPVWIDCQEPFVGCRTYYTTDGSTPTESSNLYNNPLTFTSNTTLKTKTISVFGIAEATKTLNVTVTGQVVAPVTTVSPSATVQSSFPITVTLSATDATTTYYKIGAGTQQTYTAPFQVTQSDVWATDIPVTYWSVGPGGTEAEKTITYNTASAVPAQPVVIATPGDNQVALDWTAGSHQNTLAYTVYRSTVQGQAGEVLLGTYSMSGTTWNDTTAANGTTYYYMVQAGNMGGINNSVQISATPEVGNVYSTGFGTQTVGQAPTGWTSRWVTGSETMTVVSDVTSVSGKVMRYSTTVDNNRRFWSWDVAPTYTGDWDMLVKWKISGLGTLGDIPIRAMGEVRGSTTGQYGYAGDMVTTPTMRIQDYTNGAVSTKATGGGVALSTGTWYWYRFNRTGDTLSVRMWEDGTEEPATWTIFATDTTPLTTAGWFGLGFYDNMASATRDIAWFAVSMETGGIAPSP